ncbi:hypothetical protein CTM45_11320 [Prevotella intermedia]|uniref:Uncharacterized protein n=1 Tax=Prevotella intermedia TaxID=28131 RepID=A0A2D3LN36_PREIN|nr:hypothetical protein CTM46_10890 [Prevotella intermedia]PJI21399.1 hypothetical protein CTM45_11320 [Prevotella intermedia]
MQWRFFFIACIKQSCPHISAIENTHHNPCFVKINPLKNDNCALTLRKRLFCNAKPTLLPCKTAAFGTQNNRFHNTLIIR